MAEMVSQNRDVPSRTLTQELTANSIHPAWLRLIRYCVDLRHGEIEKLKIQDGLPIAAEVTTKKIKFSP